MKQFIAVFTLFLTGLIIFCFFLFPFSVLAANFSGDHKWSWGENIGWNNFQPANGGVTVADAGLTGYLWAENVGWIKLDYDGTPGAENTSATNWGVTNDGSGNLAGYAWGENIGWVNFDSTHSQVTITNAGNFSGYAWAENVGWIKFDHTQTDYTPRTSWFFVIGPGMTSTSYKIISSDINAGGRDDSTSDSYKLKDTVGGVATGRSTNTNYRLYAGYRQLDEVAIYISLNVPVSGLTMNQPNNMSIAVNTVTNATSGAVWNVETNAPAGYTLSFQATQDNCLRDESYSPAEYFEDYSESSPGTPDAWFVDSNKYEFGFSVFGNDVPDGTWGTGSSCLTPASNNLKYRGFDSTNYILVASSSSSTSGTDTFLCSAAEQDGVFAPNGTYSANITATAVTQ